jgi:hypothetical protein
MPPARTSITFLRTSWPTVVLFTLISLAVSLIVARDRSYHRFELVAAGQTLDSRTGQCCSSLSDDGDASTFIASDGTARAVPASDVQKVTAAGWQHAIKMTDPKGILRWIPDREVSAALAAGGRIAPEHQNSSPSLQAKSEEHIKADVWVIQSPPKDHYDKAAFWIGAALAGIGVLGIFIATWTVRTIKAQVNTFVSKERARITFDIEPLNPSGTQVILYDKSPMLLPEHAIWDVDLRIANSGATNAFIETALCKVCIKELNWNTGDETITSQIGLRTVMRPAEEPFQHRERVEMDRATATAISEGSLRLCVIGHIEFGDVFDNHWTLKFCRQWGGTWFGGQWQFACVWKDYEEQTPGSLKMNGEFRVKRPSLLRRTARRMRKKDPHAPVIKIT